MLVFLLAICGVTDAVYANDIALLANTPIIWKSNQFDEIKFLPNNGCVNTTVRMHHIDADKTY